MTAVCMIVDLDDFLENFPSPGEQRRVLAEVQRVIAESVRPAGAVAIRSTPPDEWLVEFSTHAAVDEAPVVPHVAEEIRRAIAYGTRATATIAIGSAPAADRARALSEARRAHRLKLVSGGNRVLTAPRDERATPGSAFVGALPGALVRRLQEVEPRDVPDVIGGWLARAVRASPDDDRVVRLCLLAEVLSSRTGAGTDPVRVVVDDLPLDVLADLAEVHERTVAVSWLREVLAGPGPAGLRSPEPVSTARSVQRFVDEHYRDRRLSLALVAGRMHLSQPHVSHLFSREVGVGFRDYVARRRLELAHHLLTTTRMTIPQVAEASGFSSAVHLRRVMVRQRRTTPSEVRSSARRSVRMVSAAAAEAG